MLVASACGLQQLLLQRMVTTTARSSAAAAVAATSAKQQQQQHPQERFIPPTAPPKVTALDARPMPLVNVTVNGKKVSIPRGASILEATHAAGVSVPT